MKITGTSNCNTKTSHRANTTLKQRKIQYFQ